MSADWGPVVVAVVMFILLSPGLLFQLPARTRVMEFGNMYTSGISILVHAILYFCIYTILIVAIGIHIRTHWSIPQFIYSTLSLVFNLLIYLKPFLSLVHLMSFWISWSHHSLLGLYLVISSGIHTIDQVILSSILCLRWAIHGAMLPSHLESLSRTHALCLSVAE